MKIGIEYIKIANSIDRILGKGKLIDAVYVDTKYLQEYYEPAEVLRAIDKLTEVVQYEAEDSYPLYRKTYLLEQLKALKTQLELKNGDYKTADYSEVVKRILGIDIEIPQEEEINDLLNLLNNILGQMGFHGDLQNKYEQWKAANQINGSELLDIVNTLYKNYSSLAKASFLPKYLHKDNMIAMFDKECVNFELTESYNEGWTAYNYYMGDFTSKIVFNASRNHYRPSLDHFVLHEAIPGHHLCNVLDEIRVKEGVLPLEGGIKLLNTPECVFLEGTAEAGEEILLGREAMDDNASLKIQDLLNKIYSKANYYVTYTALNNRMQDADILEMLKKYRLLTLDEAKQTLNFLKGWSYYMPVYTQGRRIFIEALRNNKENAIKAAFLGLISQGTFKKRMEYLSDK